MSREVQEMFGRIAPRYDAANDVLSGGMHRYWRRAAIGFAEFESGSQILDLCCGTGDLALSLADALSPGAHVVGLDFVAPMLRLAQNKQSKRRIDSPVRFLQSDALSLPFASSCFDGAAVAFGIRNVDSPGAFLEEVRRVLKPGGKLLVLEFGKPRLKGFSRLYRTYAKYCMPTLGGGITGSRSAYEYLPRTSREFLDGERFVSLMQESGFLNIRTKLFLSGVVYAYCGETSRES